MYALDLPPLVDNKQCTIAVEYFHSRDALATHLQSRISSSGVPSPGRCPGVPSGAHPVHGEGVTRRRWMLSVCHSNLLKL